MAEKKGKAAGEPRVETEKSGAARAADTGESGVVAEAPVKEAEPAGAATKKAAPPEGGPAPADPALLERLEKLERLLERQAEDTGRIRRSRRVMSLLMLCLVLVFALGLVWLNTTVAEATSQLPQLMATADETLKQAEGALESVAELDIEALNGAIGEMEQGLAAVDFEALNDSIGDLQTAAEGLARFMSIFG